MLEEILNNIKLDYDDETTIHLAVFSEPYLDYIINGKKTIESRFSKNRSLPYQKVKTNDIIIIKQSSGPVVGYFRAGECLFYDLKKKILMKYLMSIVNHCVSMMNLLTKKEIATLQH